MSKFLRILEQQIAVFGESGSGKTVLVSSFFGATQDKSFSNELWDLASDDTGVSNRLYRNYVGMKNKATVPSPTRFAGTSYRFSVKFKGGSDPKAKARAFDTLRLTWHDYPGEWFEESPETEEEADRRVATFRSLLRSDVAFLLIDGQKLLDHKGEEERYVKSVLTNFRQGLLQLKDPLLADEGPLVEFPRIWIIALSKADLFPEWDANKFREQVVWQAGDHIDQLRDTLKEFVVNPEAFSLGEDFMLLSSAKFELSSSSQAPVAIDVSKRLGVDLILPIATMLPLERVASWLEKMELPVKLLDQLTDGSGIMASVLIRGTRFDFNTLLAKIPGIDRFSTTVIVAAKLAQSQLKAIDEQAKEKHDNVRRTLAQFKEDLDQGERDGLLIRSK